MPDRRRRAVVAASLPAMPPPEIAPVAWTPPKAPPLTGDYALNHDLAHVQRWEIGRGAGPEDVVVDGDGRAWCGLADGRILRFPAGGGRPETVARTGGRPLGVELDTDGALIVCDAERGLLRVADGAVEVLVGAVGGVPLRFCNNAAVAADGTIWFSESSTRYGLDEYRKDVLEHRGNGRLLRLDRGTGEVEVVLTGLHFANGVALDPDERFVLVAETSRYAIRRHWLAGDLAGSTEVFVDNLPGSPDNLSTGPGGTFWVAIVTPRLPALDFLLPRPRLRRLVGAIPERLQPQMAPHGIVLGFDGDGRVVANLQDPDGAFAPITGVREHDGWLYLGSLSDSALGRVALPSRERADRR
jgi:sugar lactone lactonase YvrE